MRKQILNYIRLMIIVSLTFANVPSVQAEQILVSSMPKPGTMVSLSPAFTPAHLKGMTVQPNNPLQFDFLMDQGEAHLSDAEKKQEYTKIIKYFLSSLTIAEKDQWVNLSPYESGRIIETNFGKTEMGRDLLAQDYLLKQVTSSLMYPESGLGKKFWEKVYERAFKEFGHTNIPVNTINKVWIMPDEAVVYESKNTALILKSHLKVMLEEDYHAYQQAGLAKKTNVTNSTVETRFIASQTTNKTTQDIIRQIILPELEKEINEGKNFAQLRQIVSGMILATWYKQALKESLLAKVYADKGKVKGIDQQDPKANDAIYQQYLAAFKKGVYSYIKDDEDTYTQQRIPRKYFAGGFNNAMLASIMKIFRKGGVLPEYHKSEGMDELLKVEVSFEPVNNYQNDILSSRIVDIQRIGMEVLDQFSNEELVNINRDIEVGGSAIPVLAYAHALSVLKVGEGKNEYSPLSPQASFEEISNSTSWGSIPDDVGLAYDREPYRVDANDYRQLFEKGDFFIVVNVKSKTFYPMEYKYYSRFQGIADWVALRLGFDDEKKFRIRQSKKLTNERSLPEQEYIDQYVARINVEFERGDSLNPIKNNLRSFRERTSFLGKSVEASIRGIREEDLDQNTTVHGTDFLFHRHGFLVNQGVTKKSLKEASSYTAQKGDIPLNDFLRSEENNLIFNENVNKLLVTLGMIDLISIVPLKDKDVVVRVHHTVSWEMLKNELDKVSETYNSFDQEVVKYVGNVFEKYMVENVIDAAMNSKAMMDRISSLTPLMSLSTTENRIINSGTLVREYYQNQNKKTVSIKDKKFKKAVKVFYSLETGAIFPEAHRLGAINKRNGSWIDAIIFPNAQRLELKLLQDVVETINQKQKIDEINEALKALPIDDRITDWGAILKQLGLVSNKPTVNSKVQEVQTMPAFFDSLNDTNNSLVEKIVFEFNARNRNGSVDAWVHVDTKMVYFNVDSSVWDNGDMVPVLLLNQNGGLNFQINEKKVRNIDAKNRLLKEGFLIELNAALSSKMYTKKIKSNALSADPMFDANYGGIDLNSNNFSLNIKRDGNGVVLPLIQQDMQMLNRIEGFVPRIIEIKPAVNLPILSELKEQLESAQKLASTI